MRSAITYFIRYAIVGDLITFAILLAGVASLGKIRSNFFPEVESKVILVQVVYPGAAPAEIEEGVVAKIEENLQGIAGIDQVRSVCTENAATITVETVNAEKTDAVLQDVKNAVDRIPSFPVGMEPPIVFKREAVGTAMVLALSGTGDLAELKEEARRIEQALRAVEGISQVELGGFPDEEIEIRVREDDLLARGLTIPQLAAAVRAANIEATGGKVRTGERELVVRGRYRQYRAEELRNIVVRADPDGRQVRLSDVADVVDQWAEDDPTRNWYNGKPSVTITVNNLNSEDILDIASVCRDFVEQYNTESAGTRLDVVRDGSVVLRQRIDLLTENGIQGFFLVLLFLALFLNWRLSFWVAISIPVSFAGMFALALWLGITINVISLFGMIIVVGILVDDGIVIAENIFQHHERGASRFDAALNGTLEVLPAVAAAVLTTVVAFGAFFFIEGRLGDVFGDMAVVIIVTLLISLVEGALILPAHVAHSKALKREGVPSRFDRGVGHSLEWFKARVYAPVLNLALRRPWLVFSSVVALFLVVVPGLIGGGFVKTTFFPFIEGDNISVTLTMEPGTREGLTQSELDRIEQVVWTVNDSIKATREDGKDVVLAVDKRIGPAPWSGTLNIQLLDGETRNMQSVQLGNLIRTEVGPIYGAENLSFQAFSPFGRPVAVSLLGSDLTELRAATEELKAALQQRDDVKDVTDNFEEGLEEIEVRLTPRGLAWGLTAADVIGQIRQAYFGQEVQRLQRGRDEVRVWVRLAAEDRANIGRLEDLRVRTPAGTLVALHEVADVEVTRGVTAINRLQGRREIQVGADLAFAKASATDINGELQTTTIPAILEKYPTVSASYEGQNRETLKSQKSIQRVLPIVLLIMFFITVLTFRSPLQAAAVFALIPFALIGVVAGHWLLGAQISMFSMLGMVALLGILVNDALVFVAAYNGYLKQGLPLREAIWEAGMTRLRPIFLTTATTVAGLGPLMLNTSFQAQFLVPMAISVAFGLLFLTVLTLVLLPVFLLWINPLHSWWQWVIGGIWPQREAAEPAVREDVEIQAMQND
jgi:multidrug efflux pump subunit AcrB